MEPFRLIWAAFTAVGWLGASIWVWRGQRSVGFLKDAAPAASGPRVSFVVAGRNEAAGIESAVCSMLDQKYPAFEVIMVNDRSTDASGAILEKLAAQHPLLRVITLTELPADWIGKNHALWQGAQQAQGEFIVFADADILMDPSVLSRAMRILEREKLDHLAIAPEVTGKSLPLQALVSGFTLNFCFYAAPWKARDPESRFFIGVGAFNLVRASAYQAIGTHAAFRFSPIDDMVLGQRLKQAGFRQDMRFGRGLMKVEWYRSVSELARGLEKNAFAGAWYRLDIVLLGTVVAFAAELWPFMALGFTSGLERALYGVAAFLMLALAMDNTRYHGQPRWMGLFFPLSALFGVYVVWRSALLALIRGGIEWRGTRYPLAELKKRAQESGVKSPKR